MKRTPVRPVLIALLAASCTSAEDRAAKERIFSPEDPPKMLQAAAEKLDAAGLADAALSRRVLSIRGAEAAFRIGPHVQKSTVTFRWSSDGRSLALAEERHVALAAGGDFHVRIDNDQREGMEWYRVAGISYARSRHAALRERRRDRGSSEHVLQSGYAALDTFEDVMRGAVRFTPAGKVTFEGRPALRYTAALGEPRPDPDLEGLPPIEFPKNGPDPDTKLRLEASTKGVPTSVTGTLVVDEATAVPLEARLRGELVVDGEPGKSTLELTVDLKVSGIGKDPGIEVPEHLPDEPRRPGVVATLEAYGVPRASADDGAGGAKAGEAEPPDEE